MENIEQDETQVLKWDGENDYILEAEDCWILVDGISVYVRRSDEGVSVSLFPEGYEFDDTDACTFLPWPAGEKLSVEERLKLIEESGWPIAWDGCHKLYFLQDEGREAHAKSEEYEIFPSTELKELWEKSCSLRFISRWGYHNGDFEHPWNIKQFEEDK